jgi:hypothetical protein
MLPRTCSLPLTSTAASHNVTKSILMLLRAAQFTTAAVWSKPIWAFSKDAAKPTAAGRANRSAGPTRSSIADTPLFTTLSTRHRSSKQYVRAAYWPTPSGAASSAAQDGVRGVMRLGRRVLLNLLAGLFHVLANSVCGVAAKPGARHSQERQRQQSAFQA